MNKSIIIGGLVLIVGGALVLGLRANTELAAAESPALAASATADVAPSASPDDAAIIAEATSGLLTATAGEYFEPACNESTRYDAQVIDLNADGQPEVFTQVYGICLGGQAGVNLTLYIKDKNGQWQGQFGFPGTYTVLESKNLGYPDIEIGGPGFCAPVWRWNGEVYDIYKDCEP